MSKIEYSYACPNCGSIHLQVSVTARAALTQDEEDGNLQTWVFGDHEWDNDSPMECSDCQYSGSARHFIYVPSRSVKVSFDKAWLADETDVERYLESMREALLDEIRKGKRIQI